MDPIEHYLWLGARLGQNPSLKFDTSHYLKTYPDVAKSGANPLVHYINVGKAAGYSIASPKKMKAHSFFSAQNEVNTVDEELKQENELLLLQLRQVQEELETYYLKYQELKNNSSRKVG